MALVNSPTTQPRKSIFSFTGVTTATGNDFPFTLVDGTDFSLNGSTGMECVRSGRYLFRLEAQNASVAGTWEFQKNGVNVSTISTINGVAQIRGVWADDLIAGDVVTIENVSGPTSATYLIVEIEAV